MLPDVLQPEADLFKSENLPLVIDGRLIGSECRGCGALAFPRRHICQGCGLSDLIDAALEPAGVLYSYTTVHVSGSRATPYTLGYVDLDDGVRVLATIKGPPEDLSIGMRVRLEAESVGHPEFSADDTGGVSAA